MDEDKEVQVSPPASAGISREEAEALKELLEVAVELRRSGILALIKTIAELGERIGESIASDPSIMRGLGLLQAGLSGIGRPEPGVFKDARMVAEDSIQCLLAGLSATRREGWKPAGILELLGALRDERIRAGLGFILSLARGVGGCLLEKRKDGKAG